MATVTSLFVSTGIGQPMQERSSVRALAGKGLEGDRYAVGQGSYSKHRRPAARHVSLISHEALVASNEELVQRGLAPFEPRETRRNIIVEGIDVHGLLGREFCVGNVRMRGSEPTKPCLIPSKVAGKSGFAEAYRGRGGIRAEVLSDGVIAIGDSVSTKQPLADFSSQGFRQWSQVGAAIMSSLIHL